MADKVAYNSYVDTLKADLIVPIEQLMATSALDFNVDENKLIFACVNAQKLYLEPMIGSALLRKLQESTLPFAYQLLLDRFLNDAIINWGVAESIRSIAYSVANGGVYKHLPTDAEPVTGAELSAIRQDYLSKADTFAQRCIDFLCKNSSFYPEFSENTADGLNANKKALYTGGLSIELSGPTNYTNSIDIPKGVYGNGCGFERVGNSDPSIFIAVTSWGNSNEITPDFDPAVLAGQANELPPDVFAQPVNNYFWIVSEVDFKIQQMGIDIPLDDFNNIDPLEGAYVKTNMNNLFWVRIKIAGVYEVQVQFQVVLV